MINKKFKFTLQILIILIFNNFLAQTSPKNIEENKGKKEWKALPLINFSTQVNPDDNVPKYLGNKPNVEGWKNHSVANYNLKDYNYNEKKGIYERKTDKNNKICKWNYFYISVICCNL